MASAVRSSFQRTYRFCQRAAHEKPAIFYSLVIGAIGPVMVLTIPPIRKKLGYVPPPPPPVTYPIPQRPRRPVQGYEDE
ncbi:hypothetical protein K488DRAFT_52972 [Vararia minispora EC-137]|uniref:Uncharacterized protein n=1 Tax=Vararia minispora EC-137 TaxID=1314806 RepID=A0ACB8QGS4_9AGAM|nr:hypothetical protein K488DRAFT_52972 [Vararia minispora EC-137]